MTPIAARFVAVAFALAASGPCPAARAADADPFRGAIAACLTGSPTDVRYRMANLAAVSAPAAELDRIYLNVLQSRIPFAARATESSTLQAIPADPAIWTIGPGAGAVRVTMIVGTPPQTGIYCSVILTGDRSADAVDVITTSAGAPLPPLSIAGNKTIVWRSPTGKLLPRASVMLATISGRIYTTVYFYPQ